jgi:hypothetical protein
LTGLGSPNRKRNAHRSTWTRSFSATTSAPYAAGKLFPLDARRATYFSAPTLSPSWIRRWNATYTASTGSRAITSPAKSALQSER